MRAVDTNVLVRALVRDDEAQSARAEALLTSAAIFIPVTVILELEWVLRSRYSFAPKLVAQAIEKITSLENVVVDEREAVQQAAVRASQGWDFADALHHALSAGCDDFLTFDAELAQRGARAKRATASGTKFEPAIAKL